MVCRFVDSFDYYATANINRKWNIVTNLVTISTEVTRTGPNVLKMLPGTGQGITKALDSQASWIVGYAFRITTLPAQDNIAFLFSFFDAATVQCALVINIDGKLEVTRGTTTAVAGGESVRSVNIDTWYYVEMKVTIADSIGAGTCEVRINGKNWLTVDAGEDLQVSANATADIIRITMSNVNAPDDFFMDDLYFFDGTGSENNDFAGDVKVAALFSDGNGTTSDFDGSDGNSVDNYLLVDENPTDDDSTYVESSTPGDIDLYTFDDMSETPSAIHAVQTNNVMRKSDAGGRTIRSVARPVGTNFFGFSKAPSAESFTNEEEVYDLNPETSLAWTEVLLNATEFGVEIET